MPSDSKPKALKPADKALKVADNHRLFAVVMPNGLILWRMRYTQHDKKRELALGKCPA
jgi:bacteriophage P4-like integrase